MYGTISSTVLTAPLRQQWTVLWHKNKQQHEVTHVGTVLENNSSKNPEKARESDDSHTFTEELIAVLSVAKLFVSVFLDLCLHLYFYIYSYLSKFSFFNTQDLIQD